ncbi:aldose 1-epimerase family protein [Streptomyces sp. NPDC048191]|uniref:aldose 1-epimerase family protein n=1 Tax=Streptomyces sp. NPDC048191 TaxID=3155484 RepID=UPI0033C524E8
MLLWAVVSPSHAAGVARLCVARLILKGVPVTSFGRRTLLTAAVGTGLATTASPAFGATRGAVAGSGPRADSSLSGRQYEISYGDQRVVVTELGAGLRSYRVGATELLDTFGPRDYPTGSSYGQLLVPWPNRIDHGTYVFDGVTQELPWSEPQAQNAIHGLTRWVNWFPIEQSHSRLVMGLTSHAQPGYPFVLKLRQTYELSEHGLTVTNSVVNLGNTRTPYGMGQHPYFTLGTELIDDIVLTLPARAYFLTNDRSIPEPPPVTVQNTPYDFRSARPVGDTVMDTGFTDLSRGRDGRAWVHMTSPKSPVCISVWLSKSCDYLQVYTGDTLPVVARRRKGLAIEPYTCASNAFNNKLGLRILAPGQTFEARWGVRPSVG